MSSPGSTPPAGCATPATAALQDNLLAILYRYEGQDERNQRLIRTKVGSTLSLEALHGLLQEDGVDCARFKVRVFDEHFRGYLVPAEPLSVAALRSVQPSASVPGSACALEVLLEPSGGASTAAPWLPVAAAWPAACGGTPPPGCWTGGSTPPPGWPAICPCRRACHPLLKTVPRPCVGAARTHAARRRCKAQLQRYDETY